MDQASEQKTTFSHLPCELQVSIFKFMNATEISELKRVCGSFSRLINNNCIWLARHQYKARVDSSSQIHIELASGSGAKTFHLTDDYAQLEQCMRHIQLINLIIQGPIEEEIVNSLVSLLYKTQQFQVRLFEMQSVSVESEQKCSRLFQLLASGNCQAITLDNCKLACGFTKEQSAQLEDLCQFTVKNCKPSNGLGILGKYLSKLAADMRFKPRRSMPFYAEAPNIKVSEISQFIKTWIAIFEAPHFQIYVNNCEPGFKTEFLRECAENGLVHNHLEFKSKSHPMAHIKVVLDDQRHRMQMFPIVDVPPRIERSFCTPRQFRDF